MQQETIYWRYVPYISWPKIWSGTFTYLHFRILQCGPPPVMFVGLYKPPVTIVISTIKHSYWSYVHQLSYLGGLTLWRSPRSKHCPVKIRWSTRSHLARYLPESAVCAVQWFFLGEIHQHGHSTMNGNSIKCFFWLGKFNEVWNLWDLYQQWAYQKINEVQWIGLGENHHPKPWLLPSGN